MALVCRVCDSTDLAMALDLGEQPHCNSLLTESDLAHPEPAYPLRLWFCRGCTTVQIYYTIPKETMFSEYLYVSGTTATLREHFRQSAEHLVAELGLQRGDLVVDIGSNDGTWLKAFQASGMRALGVEPASNIARQAEAEGVPRSTGSSTPASHARSPRQSRHAWSRPQGSSSTLRSCTAPPRGSPNCAGAGRCSVSRRSTCARCCVRPPSTISTTST